jgi:hypothetical protein
MKVLFSALHHAYFRNFESVVRELAARGHAVHLTADEGEKLGGHGLAERLAEEYAGQITWGFSPSLEDELYFDAARKLRLGLDYARVLQPLYLSAPKLRTRARERAPRIARWLTRTPLVGPAGAVRTLKHVERMLPVSPATLEYLRAAAPDVVVLASLTYSRSQQLDMLKAARVLGIPVAAAIMSWDHLSSKALLHIEPDMVLLWNDVQAREAIEMHGLSADRIVRTGAQCYDQWFTRQPHRSREAFCAAMGLRADRPFALWVCSTFTPQPSLPEPALVRQWIEALRASSDPGLRELGVLVRPHPERLYEWDGIDVSRYPNVGFHGRNPIDVDAKNDYFDSLSHSTAVVGLVTSAFLEAAIVGRPVLALTLPPYRMHQQEMAHFRYLTDVEGGLLRTASEMPEHFRQLAESVAEGGARDQRNTRFLRAFVRPSGLDVAATPPFADALERLAREGAKIDPPLPSRVWLQPMVAVVAARHRTRLGRWLLSDSRDELLAIDRQQREQRRDEKEHAKADRERQQAEDRDQRLRSKEQMRRQKEERRRRRELTKSWLHLRSVTKKGVIRTLLKVRDSVR